MRTVSNVGTVRTVAAVGAVGAADSSVGEAGAAAEMEVEVRAEAEVEVALLEGGRGADVAVTDDTKREWLERTLRGELLEGCAQAAMHLRCT